MSETKTAEGGEQAASPWYRGLLRIARDHPALAASFIISSLVVVRIGMAARLRPTTALALLGSRSPVSVIFGTVLSLLPWFVLLLLAIGFTWAVRTLRFGLQGRRLVFLPITVMLYTLFLTAAAFPWWFLLFVPLLIYEGLAEANTERRRLPTALTVSGVLISILLLGSQVWLPSERIEVAGGGAIVGYVVDDDGNWASVLRERDRTVLLIRSDLIVARQICSLGRGSFERSLADVIAGFPEPPLCSRRSRP